MSQSKTTIVVTGLTEQICTIARSGLWRYYPEKGDQIPFSFVGDKQGIVRPAGESIRYALISQIGISRWLRSRPDEAALLPNLWQRILARIDNVNHIGDFALLLWAGVESNRNDCGRFAKILVQHWSDEHQICNAVELGWVVQSLVRLHEFADLSADLTEMLKAARDKLLALYNPASRLFARHDRPGLTGLLSRRVACFADQIYPMLALANYGRVFHDAESIDVATAVADTICRLQGPMGQWWWHYDVPTGKVAEEYPVFSVHQDAMAPMALFAVDAAARTNHSYYIEKGLAWLDRHNELNEQMIEQDKGIIWRDIHRRELCKMFRFTRGSLVTMGFGRLHRLTGRNVLGHVVNRECRPYHLGWILYAWASASPNVTSSGKV